MPAGRITNRILVSGAILASSIAIVAGVTGGGGGGPAGTANLFVDTNGGSCVRSATPQDYATLDSQSCSSFNAAYQAASDSGGDLVLVKAGSYGSQTVSADSGKTNAGAFTTLRAATGEVVTAAPNNSGSWVEYDGFRGDWASQIGCNHVTFRNIVGSSGPGSGAYGNAKECPFFSVIGGEYGNRSNAAPGQALIIQLLSPWAGGSQPHDVLVDGVYFHDVSRQPGQDQHTECLAIWGWYNIIVRNSTFRRCAVFDASISESFVHQAWLMSDLVVENNMMDMPYNTVTGASDQGNGAMLLSNKFGVVNNVLIRNNSWVGAGPVVASEDGSLVSNVRVIGNAAIGASDAKSCTSETGHGASYDFDEVKYNVWQGASTCGDATNLSTTAGNVGFVSTAGSGGDLHIGSGSFAIGHAKPGDFPALDIDGQTRPQGGSADAGADER